MSNYGFSGPHAETVYSGDKAIPVGQGEIVELSEDDLKDERNAHILDYLEEVEAPKKASSTAKDK